MKTSKTTKRALLSSILALVLCFAMLLGTTFAWFTDTASTSVNKIQAGTLKVKLEDANGNDLEGKTLSWKKAAEGSSQEILWEPGCTYELEPVTIKNVGDLAFKFKVEVTGIGGDAKLNEAIEWTYTMTAGEGHDLGNGEYYLAPNENETATLTIKGTMKTTAGNEYQGLSIDGAAITVFATQYTYEYDSTTNEYDKDATYGTAADNAPDVWDGESTQAPTTSTDDDGETVYHISTAAQLMEVMQKSQIYADGSPYYNKTIVLDNNIDLGGATVTGFGKNGSHFLGSFDGQGYTISNFTATNDGASYYTGLFNYVYDGASIKNVTVKNATILGNGKSMAGAVIGGMYNGATAENCHAINCTVYGEKKVGGVIGYSQNSTITNCSATNCDIYCEVSETEASAGIAPQAGEVLGFNNANTTSDLTCSSCNVYFGYQEVSTADALKAALTPHGQNTNLGTIVLTSDITVSDWTAISANYTSFVLDGNGHSISGLTDALISAVGPNCNVEIKNLTLKDVAISNASTVGTQATVAALIHCVNCEGGNTKLTIDNCHIDGGSIYGWKYAGGFIGMIGQGESNNVAIKNSSVKNVSISTTDSSAGGLVAHTHDNLTITNCSVLGSTSVSCTEDRGNSDAKAGYLIGTVNRNTTTISGCTVATTATLTNNNALAPLHSGFVGRNYSTLTVN